MSMDQLLKHRIANLLRRYESLYRGHLEMTRSSQSARAHAAALPVGSVEHRNFLQLASQGEAIAKDFVLNMERTKASASATHAQLIQVMQREQQQREFHTQVSQGITGGPTLPALSPVNAIPHMEADNATHSSGNGALPVQSPTVAQSRQDGISQGSRTLEVTTTVVKKEADGSIAEKVQHSTNNTYESVAPADTSGWEKVDRKAKGARSGGSHGDQSSLEMDVGTKQDVLSSQRHTEVVSPTPATTANGGRQSAVGGFAPINTGIITPHSETAEASPVVPHTPPEKPVETKVAPWSKAAAATATTNGPSLREIQRQEELRSKAQEKEEKIQREKEEARAPAGRWNAVTPWGGAGDASKPALSLRDQIRLEEEQKRKRAAAQLREAAAAPTHTPLSTKTGWASVVGNSKPSPSRPSAPIGKRSEDATPFWDAVAASAPPSLAANRNTRTPYDASNTSSSNGPSRRTTARGTSSGRRASSPSKPNKESRERSSSEPTIIGGRISNEFANWCTENLQKLTGNPNQDTTLVEYLVTIKSPAEIRDTVVQNLGSSDKSRSFADEFIRRLEFERSSVVADAGNGGATSRRKGRRQRHAKVVDPSLVLGFTSARSNSRMMSGTMETPEMK